MSDLIPRLGRHHVRTFGALLPFVLGVSSPPEHGVVQNAQVTIILPCHLSRSGSNLLRAENGRRVSRHVGVEHVLANRKRRSDLEQPLFSARACRIYRLRVRLGYLSLAPSA